MKNKNGLRYWFVVFNYGTKNGIGTGNLGFYGANFIKNDINNMCRAQTPDALPNSVVITNLIEMTEEDYNEFWGNK